MSIIALTGGIGSGKSEAAKLFAALNVPIVDTDVIAHHLTAPHQKAIPPIIEAFGADFINEFGALDRKKMRDHVFNHPDSKTTLEHILHPLIHEEVLAQLAQNQSLLTQTRAQSLTNIHYQIIVVPLLFETNHYATISDLNVVVDCEPALQIQRATARSQLSEQTVKSIMATQISRSERLRLADIVIENNSTIDALAAKINSYHAIFNEKCFKIG